MYFELYGESIGAKTQNYSTSVLLLLKSRNSRKAALKINLAPKVKEIIKLILRKVVPGDFVY